MRRPRALAAAPSRLAPACHDGQHHQRADPLSTASRSSLQESSRAYLQRARNLPSMQLVGTRSGQRWTLNALSALGVRLVGRLAVIRDGTALFSGSLPNVCALADLKLDRLLDTIDGWAARAGIDGDQPSQRLAPTEVPAPVALSVDLRAGEIASIVWATGYRPELPRSRGA